MDLSGIKFGRWTVTSEYKTVGRRRIFWLCKCECGTVKFVNQDSLKSGKSTSCGCYCVEINLQRKFKHGDCQSFEYSTWKSIKHRCYGNVKQWGHLYKGKGITMCDRWQNSYTDFLEDIGRRPSAQHSIDRIDSNGNYEPKNCRWATKVEQSNNTSRNRIITIYGESKTLAQWATITGIGRETILGRLKKGWDFLDAFNSPVFPYKKYSNIKHGIKHTFGHINSEPNISFL